MQQFGNILFVTDGLGRDEKTLQQAMVLAKNNNAELSVLILCPSLPQSLNDYKKTYEESIVAKVTQSIRSAKSALKLDDKTLPIKRTDLFLGDTLPVRIIQHVLKYAYDLLIKEVEGDVNHNGFKALDIALLRKCPCALFLYRAKNGLNKKQRIAVAIDPQEDKPAGRLLSLKLLQTGYSLADHYNEPLDIISCWHFEMENYLRDNVWIRVSKDELEKLVFDEKKTQQDELQALIKESGIGSKYKISLVKGRAEDIIPLTVTNDKIDILVMGTVARTGISGFIIGNTAENILQKINCSLLALKPQGFVSPVSL